MPITVSELYHDTCYFFCKQIRMIFLISVSVAFFNIFMDMLFRPDIHIESIIASNNLLNITSLLELINNMNIDEKNQLLKYSILKILVLLISKTILLSSIITLIAHVSKIQKESTYYFFSLFPSLFIVNFLTIIITQLGFMCLIIPGVLLSITLPLSPIILSFKKYSPMESIQLSLDLSWKYIHLIAPGVLFWVLGKFALITLLSDIYFFNKTLIFLIVNTSINILFSILIIYLFRFYMIFLRY